MKMSLNKFIPRIGIQGKLTFIFILLSSLPLTLLSIYLFNQQIGSWQEENIRNMASEIKGLKSRTTLFLTRVESELTLVMKSTEMKKLLTNLENNYNINSESLSNGEKEFLNIVTDNDFYLKASLLSKKGKEIISITTILFVVGWGIVLFNWHILRSAAMITPVGAKFQAAALVLSSLPIALHYCGNVFWPFHLAFAPISSDIHITAGIISTGLLSLALLLSERRDWKLIIFGVLWFVAFLVPTFYYDVAVHTPAVGDLNHLRIRVGHQQDELRRL